MQPFIFNGSAIRLFSLNRLEYQLRMFDDLISMDENVLHQAARHAFAPGAREIARNVHNIFDQYFSIDSDQYVGSVFKSDTMMPERTSSYKDVNRQLPVFENEHYQPTFDSGILLRWVSRDTLKFFVPVVYFQDMINEEKQKIKDKQKALVYAFIAKPVPTAAELESCAGLKGIGVWDRSGTWVCECRAIDEKDYTGDNFGPYLFRSYNDWLRWDAEVHHKMSDARRNNDTGLLEDLKHARKHTIKELLNEIK